VLASLYVETDGAYFGLPDVDPWDERRDARNYAGPWPVVAHPPCARWSSIAGLVQHVYGYKIGDDGGCFAHALSCVRRFGGVLEHPAGTRAWKAYGLPRPATNGGWSVTFDGEAVCYVEQGEYGCPSRKPTWLYASGVDLAPLLWGNRRRREGDAEWWIGKNHPRRPGASQRMRGAKASATAPAFRDALLTLARSAMPSLDILPEPAQAASSAALLKSCLLSESQPTRNRVEAVAVNGLAALS
jgi:hypothetical protein